MDKESIFPLGMAFLLMAVGALLNEQAIFYASHSWIAANWLRATLSSPRT